MSVLKRQVNSSSNFALFFIVMTHNSSANFKVIPFLLWTKGSNQSSNFDTFKCSGENFPNYSCHFPSNKTVFLQILHHYSVSWKITPLYFFSWINIYFPQKAPIKLKIFETFECSGQHLSNSLCQLWNDKSIPLQILYPSSVSWKITPLEFFSSNNIYFARKETIKVKIFETFECSGQNLSNFLCQSWNDKSIPLQILYPSSVSWKITPLDFFSSNNIYFARKETIKVKIFETFECSGQNLSNSLCQSWNDKSIPLQILYPSSVSWKITTLYFF